MNVDQQEQLLRLTPVQQVCVDHDSGSLWVHGPVGTGKTVALQQRLVRMLGEGIYPQSILMLLTNRAQVQLCEEVLYSSPAAVRGQAWLTTFPSLCRKMVALYWPEIANAAGLDGQQEPCFLSIEATQYHLWQIVEPLIQQKGYFAELAIRRERLLSQLIDNLNKSAQVGFAHTEIEERLTSAWAGSPERITSYRQAQHCALLFRQYCLEHNLVDYSLTIELFNHFVRPLAAQGGPLADVQHVLVDNLEENVPVALDWLDSLKTRCTTMVLASDDWGGYRSFLGADPESATAVGQSCEQELAFEALLRPVGNTRALTEAVCTALGCPSEDKDSCAQPSAAEALSAIRGQGGAEFWIGQVRWVADTVAELVTERGVAPERIALIAPYVSEVMRFTLSEELAQRGLHLALLRPSMPLNEHPVVRAALTLTRLAHPDYSVRIFGTPLVLGEEDVALALEYALAGLDKVRALVLARAAYDPQTTSLRPLSGELSDRQQADAARTWQRLGYRYQAPYERLQGWLAAYRTGIPNALDEFLGRLFGEVLSQQDMALHSDAAGIRAYARLVEAAQGLYESGLGMSGSDPLETGQAFMNLVLGGMASAEYLLDWQQTEDDAVLLTPAYAYLTREQSSDYQFWMDLGANGWWTRPNQPLTHPYVLSRNWLLGAKWSDREENEARRTALARVLRGLASRCTGGIYLASSRLGMNGEEQSGPLLRAVLVAMTRLRANG